MWAEINRKAALRSRAVAVSSLPDPKGNDDDVPEGTIFEELVVQYNKLVTRAEDLIVHTVTGEVEAGLKPHFTGGASAYVPCSTSIIVTGNEYRADLIFILISPWLYSPPLRVTSNDQSNHAGEYIKHRCHCTARLIVRPDYAIILASHLSARGVTPGDGDDALSSDCVESGVAHPAEGDHVPWAYAHYTARGKGHPGGVRALGRNVSSCARKGSGESRGSLAISVTSGEDHWCSGGNVGEDCGRHIRH